MTVVEFLLLAGSLGGNLILASVLITRFRKLYSPLGAVTVGEVSLPAPDDPGWRTEGKSLLNRDAAGKEVRLYLKADTSIPVRVDNRDVFPNMEKVKEARRYVQDVVTAMRSDKPHLNVMGRIVLPEPDDPSWTLAKRDGFSGNRIYCLGSVEASLDGTSSALVMRDATGIRIPVEGYPGQVEMYVRAVEEDYVAARALKAWAGDDD